MLNPANQIEWRGGLLAAVGIAVVAMLVVSPLAGLANGGARRGGLGARSWSGHSYPSPVAVERVRMAGIGRPASVDPRCVVVRSQRSDACTDPWICRETSYWGLARLQDAVQADTPQGLFRSPEKFNCGLNLLIRIRAEAPFAGSRPNSDRVLLGLNRVAKTFKQPVFLRTRLDAR